MERAPDHRSEVVVLAGGVTTLLALSAVFALAHHGENVMLWYANYIIPVGALMVGLVAASGYGAAAWFTGLKMTRRLIWSVVGQLAVAYFIAQYEEYPSSSGMGFWAWFDASTRAIAWGHANGLVGEPLGVLGYGLRLLEVIGFVAGGLAVPLALRNYSYCDPCRSYRRRSTLAMIPGGRQELGDGGLASLAAIYEAAGGGEREVFHRELAGRGSLRNKRQTRKLPARITVSLRRCPRCAGGGLEASVGQGRGRNVSIHHLPPLPLDGERVRALFDEPPARA